MSRVLVLVAGVVGLKFVGPTLLALAFHAALAALPLTMLLSLVARWPPGSRLFVGNVALVVMTGVVLTAVG